LNEQVSDAIFGNVGTFLAFRVSEADAQVLERQFGSKFNRAHFTGLENYELCARLLNQDPFLAKSSPPLDTSRRRRQIILRQSQKKYCTPKKVVEEKIERWLKRRH
jgi:hypothetical protein